MIPVGHVGPAEVRTVRRYNFLRFSDASIIAAVDQKIVRLCAGANMQASLVGMRADHATCSPVYEDDVCRPHVDAPDHPHCLAPISIKSHPEPTAPHRRARRAPWASWT
jgi:hypothetical protein